MIKAKRSVNACSTQLTRTWSSTEEWRTPTSITVSNVLDFVNMGIPPADVTNTVLVLRLSSEVEDATLFQEGVVFREVSWLL